VGSSPNWPAGFEPLAALGSSVWRARPSDGSGDVVVKVGPSAADEAAGLRQLAAAGAPVPRVIDVAPEVLIVEWIEPSSAAPAKEEDLGRRLAALHSAPWPSWGGGSSWIGNCRVDPSVFGDAASFYGRRLRDLAQACGLRSVVEPVVERLDRLIPPDPPALLHGDLWWGNVIWGARGVPYLIDPSVHGGHPEEDLAMLCLFGPVPDRLLDAYCEVRPLGDGWRDRVGLWQLYPLLVHTVLFGGSYGSRASAVARRYGSG
jgi:fructosamine-3-kinase